MRQQYYYHPDVLKNLACAVLFDAVQVYEREQRAMVRQFKRRNVWEFKLHKSEYERIKKFLYSDNMWYDYLDIDKDYFLRMLEDKNATRNETYL